MTTRTSVTADGTTATFTVPFPYIEQDHVVVTIDGVAATHTWPTSGSITITPVPTAGAVVAISRVTPSAPLVTYTPGAVLPAADLEKDSLQALYVNEEAAEASLHLSASTVGVSTELPAPQAGYVLGWSDTEGGIINVPLAATSIVEAAEARDEAAASAADADADAATASAAASAAEAARDAALVSGVIYPDTATGLAAVSEGGYFSVPSPDSSEYLILYRDVAGVATEVKRYPSTDAVNKPKWAGKVNGWPDPFFRKFDLSTDVFLGRSRWRNHTSGDNTRTKWTLVNNTVFDGKALRRDADAGSIVNGPVVWLDEIGAVAGDTVTVYAMVAGAGAVVSALNMFKNAANGTVGTAANSTNMADVAGGAETASATPKWLRYTAVVPAGAVKLMTCPSTATAGQTFDLVAVWAFKGDQTKGPSWPTLPGLTDLTLADHETRIVSNEAAAAKANYAADSFSIVNGSAAVTLDGTGYTAFARDLVFMGWGERYTPATVSFNAVKIKNISRTVGAATKWRTLNIVIRTGANSHIAGATVVAIGSATVVETKDTQTDVTILLRDPTTNAIKTLTDADFSGGEYFIGVYGLTSAGLPAATGEPRGTFANSLGQSYYHTSSVNAPKTGTWDATAAGPSNQRLGFQHLSITAPVGATDFQPTQEFINDVAATQALPAPELVMPAYLFGVQGREMNVYTDNLHLASASEYFHNIDASGAVGAQQNERFTWTPAGAVASSTLTVTAHDKRTGASLVSKTAQLRAAASSSGTGLTKKVLAIGDSLIAANTITQTMLDIAGTDVMAVTMHGTQGIAPNKHEGRSGWTIAMFTTAGSPFYISGAVNFGAYLTNNAIATPDWVFIHLGINDCFGQTDDTACSSVADAAFTSLDTLIASIKAADASVKIGLMLPTPPSADQDSFGANYTTGQTRWRFKRNILIWARQLCAKYNGQEANRIYVVPSNTALDTVNNMNRDAAAPINSRTALTSTRQNNGVHPATEGYRQIGDALWAFLKFYA